MPLRDWRTRIEDIVEAIHRIQRYTVGLTLEDFLEDDKTADAVIRNLTIIGEASMYIDSEFQQRYPDIP